MRRPRALTSLRPLLVASAGVTALAVGSCTGISSGNLIAPVCDGGPESSGCVPLEDAGPADGGGGAGDGGAGDGGAASRVDGG